MCVTVYSDVVCSSQVPYLCPWPPNCNRMCSRRLGSQIHGRFCIILWRNLHSADQKLFFSTTVHSLILSSTSQLPDDILNSEFTGRRSTRWLCEQAKQSVRSTSGQLCSEANYGLPICGVRHQSGWKTCYK